MTPASSNFSIARDESHSHAARGDIRVYLSRDDIPRIARRMNLIFWRAGREKRELCALGEVFFPLRKKFWTRERENCETRDRERSSISYRCREKRDTENDGTFKREETRNALENHFLSAMSPRASAKNTNGSLARASHRVWRILTAERHFSYPRTSNTPARGSITPQFPRERSAGNGALKVYRKVGSSSVEAARTDPHNYTWHTRPRLPDLPPIDTFRFLSCELWGYLKEDGNFLSFFIKIFLSSS